MGGCVGTQSGGRRNSGSNSGLSDSSLAPVTKNKPLKVSANTLISPSIINDFHPSCFRLKKCAGKVIFLSQTVN